MAKKKVIIQIAFNIFKLNGNRLSRKWIQNRIALFIKYTLKSLKAQSNQDFIALVRYEPESEGIIKETLSRYAPLPDNVLFIPENTYDEIVNNYIKDTTDLYLVRIDSDDMYHRTFVQQLHDYNHKPNTQVLINQYGYLYHSEKQRIAPSFHKSPSFYVLIYKAKDYITGQRHPLPEGHRSAIKLHHEILKRRNYLNVIHSTNTSNKKQLKASFHIAGANFNKLLIEFTEKDVQEV